MEKIWTRLPATVAWALLCLACGSSGSPDSGADGGEADGGNPGGPATENPGEPVDVNNPLVNPQEGPPAGTPDPKCPVPEAAAPADVSSPKTVVGTGSKESCTSQAVVAAIAGGGVITFNCGPEPVVITLDETAKIKNDTGPDIVIDGGGLVTLSGGGQRRILYMNTCDEAQTWTTAECYNQDHPRLTVQNLTFIGGNATAQGETLDGGGGAIFARGGRLKIVNSRFFQNTCAPQGQDVGGGAVRVFDQFNGLPVYLVNSTFGGDAERGNSCSNGGAISSIGVSWTIINSVFSYNQATGNGGNPAQSGTPGGGSGGGIYNDGNTMTLSICGSLLEHNQVNSFGSAIFFISNDHSGNIVLEDTKISKNTGGSWYAAPGISKHDDTPLAIDDKSVLEE